MQGRAKPGCRTNALTGTIDRSWLIRSSSSPSCWHRRSLPLPVRTAPVDPVVRPSDRADAQANGALALAKQLGRSPRDVADAVVAAADLGGKATLEVAGPGFINVTFDDSFLIEQLDALADDDRLGVRMAAPTRACGRRLLGAERRQGDARRAPAHDRDRRRARAHARVRRPHRDPREPRRRLGHAVRHADRAPSRHRRDRGRRRAQRRRSRRLLQAGRGPSSTPARTFQERARNRVVLLQSGDPETHRGCGSCSSISSMRYFNLLYRKLGVLLTDDDLAGESMYNDLLPEVVERLARPGCCRSATAPRSCSPRATRTATATRCR